jgi:hypothetical protein
MDQAEGMVVVAIMRHFGFRISDFGFKINENDHFFIVFSAQSHALAFPSPQSAIRNPQLFSS